MADTVRVGSGEHKALFCRMFVETHDPFRPEDIAWPDLDAESLDRLKGLPVWEEAARTEALTALKVKSLGDVETDPELKEAICLQGYEEQRHADVIRLLAKRYDIPLSPRPEALDKRRNPKWTFLRTGYGECMDSFFAFGLFRIGADSKFFPEGITSVFEQIMQEEARHILFIVNWAAYLRAREPWILRPAFDARRTWNIVAQAFGRVKGAMAMAGGGGDGGEAKTKESAEAGFTMASHSSFGDFSLRSFLELCLRENERRLGLYDSRLLRPALVPPFIRLVVKVLPKKPDAPALRNPAGAPQ